ncbi:unnamed protein product [Rodentolepis nana]|uniref:Chitin-binding type-2 domain-containing protein n=1 Tax=Rodentolepis nana TaxID=102285 RepID=A0A0R3TTH2_RODNA|nr:unnamed protein product [Rodentolepis nana]
MKRACLGCVSCLIFVSVVYQGQERQNVMNLCSDLPLFYCIFYIVKAKVRLRLVNFNSPVHNQLASQSIDSSQGPTQPVRRPFSDTAILISPYSTRPTRTTNEVTHIPSQPSTFEPLSREQVPPSQPCPFNNFPYGTGIFPGVPPPIERDPEYAREQFSLRYGTVNTNAHNPFSSQSIDSSTGPTQRRFSDTAILLSPSSTRPTRTTNEVTHIPSQPSTFEPLSREQVSPSQPSHFNNFPYGAGIFPGVPPPIEGDSEHTREQFSIGYGPRNTGVHNSLQSSSIDSSPDRTQIVQPPPSRADILQTPSFSSSSSSPSTRTTNEVTHMPSQPSTFEPLNREQVPPSQPCPLNKSPNFTGILPGVPTPIERDPEYAREQFLLGYGPRNTGVHNSLPSSSIDSSPDPTHTQKRPLSRTDILPSPSSTLSTRTTNEVTHMPSQPSTFEPLSREQVSPSQPCSFNNFPYDSGILPEVPPPIKQDMEYAREQFLLGYGPRIFPGVPPPIRQDLEYAEEQFLLRYGPQRPPFPPTQMTPHHPPNP